MLIISIFCFYFDLFYCIQNAINIDNTGLTIQQLCYCVSFLYALPFVVQLTKTNCFPIWKYIFEFTINPSILTTIVCIASNTQDCIIAIIGHYTSISFCFIPNIGSISIIKLSTMRIFKWHWFSIKIFSIITWLV